MKIEIRYSADYRYAERVSFSPHLFRVIPKVDRYVKVRRFDFRTNRGAVVHWRRDLFDNEVASAFYPEQSKVLQVRFRLKLTVEPKNAFGFLLESRAAEIPFTYDAQELQVLQPYLSNQPEPALGFWSPSAQACPTIDTLVELNSALHTHLAYERREAGHARTTAETLALGRAACRDFAVVMVDTLRGLGLAARYASGYLLEFGTEDKKAEGAFHAWVETYLPGAGWIGFDPTNGTLCDHHHLTAATGVSPADISPVNGTYFHDHPVPHELIASLDIATDERH